MIRMKCESKTMLLYAVTDQAWTGTLTLSEQVEAALKGGVTCVQRREKDMPYEEFLEEAIEMKKLCNTYNVPFIINDNVDIAIECKADGIHVGQSDMEASKVRELVGEGMMLGVSVQTKEQAIAAERAGADKAKHKIKYLNILHLLDDASSYFKVKRRNV